MKLSLHKTPIYHQLSDKSSLRFLYFIVFVKKITYLLSYTHRNHQHVQSWYMVYTIYMQYAHTESGTTGYT